MTDKISLELRKFAAASKPFIENLYPDEQLTVRRGFNEFVQFFKENQAAANEQRVAAEKAGGNGNISMYRLLDDTTKLLMYAGTPQTAHKLKGFADFWRDSGHNLVADALEVRLAEADVEHVEPEPEIEESDYDFTANNEEAPPETQRSLTAKIEHYTNIFVKSIKG